MPTFMYGKMLITSAGVYLTHPALSYIFSRNSSFPDSFWLAFYNPIHALGYTHLRC